MAKILIVDDDPDVVEASSLVLAGAGYEVGTASSRAAGMEQIQSFKPDALILDVMMDEPDDGIAMAQELRRTGFTKPILMLTSLGKVLGMDFGKDESVVPVDDFVEKPINPGDLVARVKKLLAAKKGK